MRDRYEEATHEACWMYQECELNTEEEDGRID